MKLFFIIVAAIVCSFFGIAAFISIAAEQQRQAMCNEPQHAFNVHLCKPEMEQRTKNLCNDPNLTSGYKNFLCPGVVATKP